MKPRPIRASLLGSLVLGAALAFAGSAWAQSLSPELAKKVIDTVDADAKRLTDIFKDIHQNPELGFMETRTAGIVARELEALGYEVQTGIGKTGVVGVMRNGDGPVVMFRGDNGGHKVPSPIRSTRCSSSISSRQIQTFQSGPFLQQHNDECVA